MQNRYAKDNTTTAGKHQEHTRRPEGMPKCESHEYQAKQLCPTSGKGQHQTPSQGTSTWG